jgi:hypothetical protein
VGTSASTDFKTLSGNSAWSASMTIGPFARTCLISVVMTEPLEYL